MHSPLSPTHAKHFTHSTAASEHRRMSLKIATFNVHCWMDAGHVDNVERIAALIQKYDPDILCLQECTKDKVYRFLRKLPEKFYCSHIFSSACHIFSKHHIEQDTKHINLKKVGARFVIGKVRIPSILAPIYITNVHLNHREEPRRLKEMEFLQKKIFDTIQDSEFKILCGDFNALTQEDYTTKEFKEISFIRDRNSWESPQMKVTKMVKDLGFTDSWERAGKPAPVKTCRFSTRIDYVFVSKQLEKLLKLVEVCHVDDSASDHNMVVANLTFKQLKD
ncbi:hypothetical protein TCAL_00629 [Tigriopus californicus]|uniref:Endonuclease/exonuclease/phosphatase domain-containing protein n=1 Tax=Tigriopus californicus TaxID=6832 RepID=A0A553PBL1_TIGCA|nr:uncharacterized protein LOC131877026 [Tigriopus californicus]TRY75064.1 hypothetical protein TCAL_00629 [Tigriopus californicus]|eukprot:TCALIF_00629-PA protein Name:"Similar to SMPD2 Sphingomyelin phosphodiesterase 2 (Homo sapiens)" AED:0.08 eAED:0.08 QI:169/1/0.6/1/0.75/0.6/5/0/277